MPPDPHRRRPSVRSDVVQAVDGAGSVNRRECFPQLFPRRESSVTVAERTRNEEAASEGSADVEFLALHAQMAVFAREISQLYKAERLRSRELELALAGARETYVATMKSLAQVVEAKDATTRGHLDRTQAYGLALARRVDPELAARPEVAYGFFLHDIGKVGVPDRGP